MQKTIRAATLALGTFALAGFSAGAHAGYTFHNDGAGGGSIAMGADALHFTITGADGGTDGDIAYYTEIAPTSAFITFTWQYTTADSYGAVEDPGGYVIDDTLYTLSVNGEDPGTVDGGTITVQMVAGKTFGFFVDSIDSQGGAAMLAINQDLPAAPPPPPPPPAIPEPQNALLMMAGLATLFAAVRRRGAARGA